MGQNLYYRVKPKGRDLDDQLKFILRKNRSLPASFDESDINFLKGLEAAGIKDSDTLIEAIEKYGEITVYEE